MGQESQDANVCEMDMFSVGDVSHHMLPITFIIFVATLYEPFFCIKIGISYMNLFVLIIILCC